MKLRECKRIKGRRYCKIKGKWVRMDDKIHRVQIQSKSPIKIKKSVKTRTGAC